MRSLCHKNRKKDFTALSYGLTNCINAKATRFFWDPFSSRHICLCYSRFSVDRVALYLQRWQASKEAN